MTCILDLCYMSVLVILYTLNTPSNNEKAEILGVNSLGSAEGIIRAYTPCIGA